MDDVLNDALSNLVYDNYERGHKGYKSRQADVALIRAALAAQPAASVEPVVTAAMVRAAADELGKQTHPWTACVRDALRAALAAQPAASAEPSDEELARLWRQVSGRETLRPDSVAMTFARALLSRYGRPAGDADEYQAMLAVMEQIDPATFPGLTAAQRGTLGRFAKPVPAQKADDDGPTCPICGCPGGRHSGGSTCTSAAIAQQRKGE